MKNKLFLLFSIVLSGCAHVARESIDLTRNNNIKPIIGCGVQCLTIKQSEVYETKLKNFLHKQSYNKSLVVANCRNRPVSIGFMNKVARDIMTYGVRPALAQPILPYLPETAACMVLVRGPIVLYPPKCIKPKRKRGAYVFPASAPIVGDDFGCYSQQNLSYMIDNPKDLLILSGFSGEIQ